MRQQIASPPAPDQRDSRRAALEKADCRSFAAVWATLFCCQIRLRAAQTAERTPIWVIRSEDRLLILRPNKIHHLNRTATEMLSALYAQGSPDVDAIVNDARVPTASFTGGEPTLRPDLPDLIAYAKSKQLRTNPLTNGIRCGSTGYVDKIAMSGLNSAQVSLEATDLEVHDTIVGRPGAWQRMVQGIHNLKTAAIHVHTNTTINSLNRDHLPDLIDFLARMEQPYLSMNMVIRTGGAVGQADLGYSEIGDLVLALKQRAQDHGMRFVWYSPVPFCLFNPVAHGLGSQSSSAADGLLSIGPDDSVLPCSSFEQGIGNLLNEPFDEVWNRRAAKYWRHKEFLPPGCGDCEFSGLCCGACPLYWDEKGHSAEIAEYLAPTSALSMAMWQAKRKWLGVVKGVGIK